MALEIEPFPGEELEKLVTDLKKLPREATEKIREHYGATMSGKAFSLTNS